MFQLWSQNFEIGPYLPRLRASCRDRRMDHGKQASDPDFEPFGHLGGERFVVLRCFQPGGAKRPGRDKSGEPVQGLQRRHEEMPSLSRNRENRMSEMQRERETGLCHLFELQKRRDREMSRLWRNWILEPIQSDKRDPRKHKLPELQIERKGKMFHLPGQRIQPLSALCERACVLSQMWRDRKSPRSVK